MNENLKTSLADWRNRWTNLNPLTFGHAKWVKGARSAGAALLLGGFALSLGGCAGYYEPGFTGAYYDPDYAPYYPDYGYNDGLYGGFGAYTGDVLIGGIHHHGYYGGHHFSHDFHGGGGSFHGGGGSFHGGGHGGGGGHHR
ncbi:MAG: hypothetical protein P4L99_04465 [Chthoniobacter sp.]|nr:hypothetical protein [Chthoniobacter sp.]